MGIEFDLCSAAGQKHALRARIHLRRDRTWAQVSRGAAPEDKDRAIPVWGHYGKSDGRAGTSLFSLMLGVQEVRQTFLILTDFYPATAGKRGTGYLQAVGGTGLKGAVEFTIRTGENAIPDDRAAKFAVAIDLGFRKSGAKLPAKLKELLDPAALASMGAFLAAHAVKNPRFWFVVLRQAAGAVLKWGVLLYYYVQLDKFTAMVEAATTQDELEEAGEYLADVLAGLYRDIGLTAVAEVVAMMRGRQAVMCGPNPPMPQVQRPSINTWRTALGDLLQRWDWARRAAAASEGRPHWQTYQTEMLNLHAQMRFLTNFVVETVHHMEVVTSLAKPMSALCRDAARVIAKGPDAAAPKVAEHLLAVTTKAGCPLTPAEAESLARTFVEAHRKGKLGDVSWPLHDIETAATSKLSAAVATGMKNPIKPPEGWTLADLETAAKGINPKTRQPFTDAEYADLLPPKFRAEVEQMYGLGPAKVFGAAADARRSIDTHNVLPHHNPQTFAEHLELACDVAHALAQKRAYRPAALSDEAIIRIINTDAKLAPHRAWIKLGYATLKTLNAADYVDPKTVSAAVLRKYGQGELARTLKIQAEPGKK